MDIIPQSDTDEVEDVVGEDSRRIVSKSPVSYAKTVSGPVELGRQTNSRPVKNFELLGMNGVVARLV